jgi:hypothetical protein
LVLYPLGGIGWLFELPPKRRLCIWTHSYLMYFGGHVNPTFYTCLLDELVVLIYFIKLNI